MPHRITLAATDSRYATDDEIQAVGLTRDQLANSVSRLMAHQVRTLALLRDESVDIIINEAMTGDGKTLAAQLYPLLTPNAPALFMYPTNELIRDQESGLRERLISWPEQTNSDLALHILNADKLDELEINMRLNRADAIEIPLKRDFVLTNPDIFHLLMQLKYIDFGTAQDTLLGKISGRFRLYVFDEFHLFGTPQVAAAMTAMLLLRSISQQRPLFLYLSATPQSILQGLAQSMGLSVRNVEGVYLHGAAECLPDYRRILQAVNLHLYAGLLEAWTEAHIDDVIIPFYLGQRPYGAKGAIIANGIAVAHRLYALLKARLAEYGITVGINTGVTGYDERRASRDADLIIGTSTIDVGVDFRINLLIFKSVDAATHMQRLGRLGRHTTDQAGNTFVHYEAHALLPPWITATVSAEIADGSAAIRPDYARLIDSAFSPTHSFEHYARDWAGLQAAHVLHLLEAKEIKNSYREVVKQLTDLYSTLYGQTFRSRYYAMAKEKRERPLLRESMSFRGGSPFTALVVDAPGKDVQPKAYNLLTLLRQGDIEPLDLESLLNSLNEEQRKTLARHQPMAAYRLHDWLPKPRRMSFRLEKRIDEWSNDRFGVARVQKGFHIEAENVPRLYELNRNLVDKEMVVTLARGLHPDELRRRLRLGWQLALYEFTSEDNVTGCVAFSRDALLLHTALKRSSIDASGDSLLLL